MLVLMWPLIILTTVVLYLLILITLPFNSVYATLFLFTLIGFWTRLPGVGAPHPFWILYNMDLIDVFSIIIAINLGGPTGAMFALFTNIWSRFCGVWPDWLPVMKDSIFQAILCLFMPIIYALTGSLLATTVAFTVGRSLLFITVGMFVPHRGIIEQIFAEIQFQATLLFINGMYVMFFGNFFSNLLEKGVQFSWILFLFATAVIVVAYIIMQKKSGKDIIPKFILKKMIPKKRKSIHPMAHLELQPMEQVYKTPSYDDESEDK